MVECAVHCLSAALSDGQPSHVSHASRALVTLFEALPFHRLENGLLTHVFEKLMPPSSNAVSNPVIQIAVLQVFAVIVSMSPAHTEVRKILEGKDDVDDDDFVSR